MPTTRIATALLACALASVPALAEADTVFSTSANQFAQTPSGGTMLLHEGLNCSASGAIETLITFVSGDLGLDAVDLESDGTILFSVETSGVVFHVDGPIFLDHDRIYGFDPGSGRITPGLEWSAWGIEIGTLDALDRIDAWRYAFSTSLQHWVTHPGGQLVLRPESVYVLDTATGMLTTLLDGVALGLSGVDAVQVLDETRVAFSTPSNVWVNLPSGGQYLRHQNAYVFNGDDLATLFDGESLEVTSLDAFALSGGPVFFEPNRLIWGAVAAASAYDVVYGDLLTLTGGGGDYSVATTGCAADDHALAELTVAATPAPGQGTWFLVRNVTPAGNGTYDSAGGSQVSGRDAGIAASGVDCD
jgi:hypothetical protein